jgi:hypothetical protein
MTTPTTHPDLESLAAFVDGRLAGAEHARVIEHLARCEDCFEVVAETGEVQEELEEDEASQPGGAFEDNVVVHPSAWRRWAPAAAALAAALVLAVFGVWRMGWLLAPDLSVDTLASRLAGSTTRLDDEAWENHGWPGFRGGESSLQEKAASFRAGVHAVDLQVALRRGDRDRATGAATDLLKTLRDLASVGPVKADYQQVSEWLESDRSPAEIADRAAAAEEDLIPLIDDERYYKLGKWAEAGRLAALAGDRRTLRSRSLRGGLEDLLEEAPDEDALEEAVTDRLGAIRERLRGDLSDSDLDRLAADFTSIVGGDGVRVQEPLSTEPAEE